MFEYWILQGDALGTYYNSYENFNLQLHIIFIIDILLGKFINASEKYYYYKQFLNLYVNN